MAGPSSLTLDYDAILSTTLFNYRKTLEDQISTANALLHMIMKKVEGAYESVADLGDRLAIPLMYALGAGADSYSGYDTLSTTPTDGITTAFYDWRQASIPVSISGLEEKKNTGEAQIINLLESKTKQATMGLQEFFARGLQQGNGPNSATAITTPRTSPNNASLFIEPLPKLIAYDPTASVVVGNINQSTYTWWRNQFTASGSSTYAGFLKDIRHLYNNCSKGPGGPPDFFWCDQNVFELYEAALAAAHRNPSYGTADIPFDNVKLKGGVLTWDEFVPDVANGTITSIPVAASGTLYAANLKFLGIKYHKGTNFSNTPFQRPVGQDAKVSQIMWLGQLYTSNRRKQGVMGSIDTTIAA